VLRVARPQVIRVSSGRTSPRPDGLVSTSRPNRCRRLPRSGWSPNRPSAGSPSVRSVACQSRRPGCPSVKPSPSRCRGMRGWRLDWPARWAVFSGPIVPALDTSHLPQRQCAGRSYGLGATTRPSYVTVCNRRPPRAVKLYCSSRDSVIVEAVLGRVKRELPEVKGLLALGIAKRICCSGQVESYQTVTYTMTVSGQRGKVAGRPAS
jgi:hypothetical protein